MKIRISAVIPLYNKAHTIARAVESVLSQSRLPEAIVVVDDGSTDDSAVVCRAALNEVPRSVILKYVTQVNSGVSVARNSGAEAFESDLIAFLDADDEWRPSHLAEIERLSIAVPEAGLLSTRHARVTPDGRPVPERSVLAPGFFGRVENGLAAFRQGYGILHTSTVAVERNAWNRSGGFLPGARKSQDLQLWLRLLLNEVFAHSDKCTGIWHEESTGVVSRSGVVPAHFSYFLGSSIGRAELSNPDLQAFLGANLASHVGGHRLRQEDTVVRELLELAQFLPLVDRLRAQVIARAPRTLLGRVARRRRLARKSK